MHWRPKFENALRSSFFRILIFLLSLKVQYIKLKQTDKPNKIPLGYKMLKKYEQIQKKY